jgi:hypothetical protein
MNSQKSVLLTCGWLKKNILHLTAFENSAAFRDYIDATTAELDDPFAQDDATDFGLLALRDRPVAEWGGD